VIDDKLYVLPGYCSDTRFPQVGYCDHIEFRRLWRYNPATNLWATKRPAPHYHRLGAAGVINGKFYVAGGYNGFAAEGSLDVYDPATDTWKTLAPLPTAGRADGAVLLGKLFVVAWGVSQNERHLYAYNPANNTWATKAPPSKFGPVARVDLGGLPYLLLVSGKGSELNKP
jgi:N-acetylneuraminic acid mutarotase